MRRNQDNAIPLQNSTNNVFSYSTKTKTSSASSTIYERWVGDGQWFCIPNDNYPPHPKHLDGYGSFPFISSDHWPYNKLIAFTFKPMAKNSNAITNNKAR